MNTPNLDFLSNDNAKKAFIEIQKLGYLNIFPEYLTPNEQAYLIGESYVRESKYSEIEASLPNDADDWWKRLALCTGYLFTAPLLALKELDYLYPNCQYPIMTYRLNVWKMHLNLLLGFEEEGKILRDAVIATNPKNNPWEIERLTLLAVSYFSTSNSSRALELHRECLELLKGSPEQYFQAFGCALGMRAALKICDAQSFDLMSAKLDEALGKQPDERYLLRQHGYRAMVLTQLGEKHLAQKYWDEGDNLLETVDEGGATIERAQFLMFRCLAAALMGNTTRAQNLILEAEKELMQSEVLAVHMAELNVCKLLTPVANPILRAKNIGATYESLKTAKNELAKYLKSAKLASVKTCYEEAISFCDQILYGKSDHRTDEIGDKWKTLTISVIDNFQLSAEFAERLDYFRLIPKFVNELSEKSLCEEGIRAALQKVLPFPPHFEEGEFKFDYGKGEREQISQFKILLNFANSLLDMASKAEINTRQKTIADTTQIIVHEMKRPFYLLDFTMGALQERESIEEMRSLIESTAPAIKEAANRAKRLTSEILTCEKSRKLKLSVVEPKNAVDTAINELQCARGQEHKISKNLNNYRTLFADEEKIVRALENLVENALDASPDSEIKIETFDSTVDSKPAVTFSVANCAVIPEIYRSRLFDKSFTNGKINGTGFGLAIVKNIVEEHGGEISFTSESGIGTKFSMSIPSKSIDFDIPSVARHSMN